MPNTENTVYPLTVPYTFGGEKVVHVRTRIPYSELNTAVSSAIDAMYAADGSYLPAFKSFVLPFVVVHCFTDYSDGFDVDRFMDLIECSDFYKNITDVIDEKQYFHIQDAIDDGIEYRNSRSEADAFFREARRLLSDLAGPLTRLIRPDEPGKAAGNAAAE